MATWLPPVVAAPLGSGDGECDRRYIPVTYPLHTRYIPVTYPLHTSYNAVTSLLHQVTESAIAQLMHIADEDGNGTLEWDEFLALFKARNGHVTAM